MAGDGLDREAIERRAEAAGVVVGGGGGWQRYYATDVPALLAALRAAEGRQRAVEEAAWGVVWTQGGMTPDHFNDALLNLEGVLRTEGGAS